MLLGISVRGSTKTETAQSDASVAETTISSDHNHEATSHGKTVSSIPAVDAGFSLASHIFSRTHVQPTSTPPFRACFPLSRGRICRQPRFFRVKIGGWSPKQLNGSKERDVSALPRGSNRDSLRERQFLRIFSSYE